MAEINKPSDINKIWAAGGAIVTPADTKIDTGWIEEIPPHEYENFVQNKQDLAIAHINQHGIAVWDAVTEYQAGKSYVTGSNGKIYLCITTNKNSNPVTDTSETNWLDFMASNVVVLTSSQTWAVPKILSLGFKKAKVTVIAGGGSGGSGQGSAATGTRGAGGGAGGTSIAYVSLVGVTSVPVVVGSGGARVLSGNTNGNPGGSSSFNSTINVSGGGGGGRYNTATAPAGGFGGSASGGQINLRGGDGSDGPIVNANIPGGSGDGGASSFGGGTRGSSSAVTTIPVYGAGGGGAVTASNPGAPGVVIIEY